MYITSKVCVLNDHIYPLIKTVLPISLIKKEEMSPLCPNTLSGVLPFEDLLYFSSCLNVVRKNYSEQFIEWAPASIIAPMWTL